MAMSTRSLFLSALVGSLALAAASAGPAAADAQHPCFFINQWQGGWKAPDDHTIYIRVNIKDIYRLDLSAGSQQLTWPGNYHLVNVMRGSSSICTPLDFQLSLTDGRGFRQGLIVSNLTKLTPDQIAALPRKDLP
jgi:hypothetical protein